ncbi:hypothetical protein WJX72_004205 [[Myrmecia] bisecta]|uniref:PPM-type phosphatase domain-containing protein n=1 Tax=[Myrmecia] bisecta TaxID=41462 RepID=A0AAW1PTI7_9CHLO
MDDMFADLDEPVSSATTPASPTGPGAKKAPAEDLYAFLAQHSGPAKRSERQEVVGGAANAKRQRTEGTPSASEPAGTSRAVRLQCTTHLETAASEDRGSRAEMEDVQVQVADARRDKHDSRRVSFFAVLDGHGGRNVAHFASEHLHESVLEAGLLTNKDGGAAIDAAKRMKQAVLAGFEATDKKVVQRCAAERWMDGATCVAVWVVEETVVVANIGDSKCVLARTSDQANSQGQVKAITLTRDHKAFHPAERTRIEQAGGVVAADGRLEGRVEVSRSFGDRQFKQKGMVATPHIQIFNITDRDQFLLCGCDGFWGVFGPEDAVKMASKLLGEGRDAKATCNRLINEAIRERRCKDNCTVMLIRFLKQPTDAKGTGESR